MKPVKKLFINGKVITMDPKKKKKQAFMVEGEFFTKTGSTYELLTLKDEDTEVIDLRNRCVLPGLNDSHMHLLSYALSTKKVNLSHCQSLKEVEESLQQFIEKEEEAYFGEWIVGHGWNQENFDIPYDLTAEFLDRICCDRPIFLSRACYHICAVNSKALEMAGIGRNTADPKGGKIDRDPETGKPTGILREKALQKVYSLIPIPSEISQIKKLIQSAAEDALKMGLTSVQSDDFGHLGNYERVLIAYKELEREGNLKIRVNLQMLLQDIEKLKEFLTLGISTGMGSPYLRYGPLKILSDGSLGARTAALEEPYHDDDGNQGILIYRDHELLEILEYAHQHGLQLAVHAIGDRAMKQVLNLYEKLFRETSLDHRSRLIHCQITNWEMIKKMAELKVIADIQPAFVPTDMKIVEERVGKKRAKESYNWKRMIDEGVKVAGGSDSPIESFNPFLGIYSAVTRKNYEGIPKGGWYPEQKLTLEEAIALYTTGPSYATFEEKVKGKIKEGYFADFIILDRHIDVIKEEEIKEISVLESYVGGKCQYKAEG